MSHTRPDILNFVSVSPPVGFSALIVQFDSDSSRAPQDHFSIN